MCRRLSALFFTAACLFLMTLPGCDSANVVEVPGREKPVDASSDKKPASVDKLEVTDPFLVSEMSDEVKRLTQLPADRSPESLCKFLEMDDEKGRLLESLFKSMKPAQADALEAQLRKVYAEAANAILADPSATLDQCRQAVFAKARLLQNQAAVDACKKEAESLRKAGKTEIAWEMDLTLLQIEYLLLENSIRSQEDLEKAKAQFKEIRTRAVELLALGKNEGLHSPESISLIMGLISGANGFVGPSEEGDQAMKALRDTLATAEPTEKLSKNTMANLLLQMDIGLLIHNARDAFMDKGDIAQLKSDAFDPLLSDMVKLLKKATEDKVSLAAPSVAIPLQLANHWEPWASRDNVAAVYDALLAAMAINQEADKEALTNQVLACQRCFNLPGTEMEFHAVKADGTLVSLKDFVGKVVLLDVFPVKVSQAYYGEYMLAGRVDQMYKDAGLQIIWYSTDPMPENPKDIPQAPGLLTFPMPGATGPADLVEYYGLYSQPRMILIGKDGKVVSTNLDGNELVTELEKLFPGVKPQDPATAQLQTLELETTPGIQPIVLPEDETIQEERAAATEALTEDVPVEVGPAAQETEAEKEEALEEEKILVEEAPEETPAALDDILMEETPGEILMETEAVPSVKIPAETPTAPEEAPDEISAE